MSPSSSGPKNELRKLWPEDGGVMFLRNVVLFSTDYKTLYPGRQNTS
jgi:hypothetical protein